VGEIKLKLLFCGQLKSPFIRQDAELLKRHYDVEVINLNFLSATRFGSFKFIYKFFISIMFKICKVDIVYIWFADYHALPIVLISKLFNKRSIVVVGGWEVSKCEEIGYGNQLNIIRGFVTRLCLRKATYVAVPSEAYKRVTHGIEPLSQVYVVPNAIDSKLCDVPVDDNREGVVTALCTIKFTELLKGIPTFRKAALKLPYTCEVIEAMPHEKLMEKLRKTKVYCQLSYTESFGMTILEAMACGCVPVVTDRDAPPEVIGDTGVVVPYGDVEATVKGIEKAMTMDGSRARDRARKFNELNRILAISRIIKNQPLVSVVIPSYNSEKWLDDTIKSILTQSYLNKEIIVVDDCSTDNTKKVMDRLMIWNPDVIKYMRNEVNSGECISSRRGFAAACGEFICRLSSDDVYADYYKLQCQVECMQRTGADWSYNSINCVGTSLHDSKLVESIWLSLPIPSRYGIRFLRKFDNIILQYPRIAFLLMLGKGNPINSSTLMFRKSSYMKYEQWSDSHRTDCDGLLLFKSLLKGTRGVAVHSIGSLYRTHPGQMSYNPKYIHEMKVIRTNIYNDIMKGDYPWWLKVSMKFVKKFRRDIFII
jgi:glycosyltransferase involved in cell wall biosynthesis